jgi:CubicO group peptidase (beta-lactamase class C family)
LPIYEKYSKGYLTIRHCLSNTTGLEVEKGGLRSSFQKTKFASLEEQVNSFASKHEIVANPGEQYYYSQIGLNIAARVLEVVSKKSFDRLALKNYSARLR